MAIPAHVAIIMDGNGRWAQSRGLPRSEGHRKGAKIAAKIPGFAEQIGIKYITLFAFSSENFSRPKSEVQFLIGLFEKFLKKYRQKIVKQKFRFRVIGDLSKFPQSLQMLVSHLEQDTSAFDKFNLTIALNYGARDEITHAIKQIVKANNGSAENLSWSIVKNYLYTSELPDPDLIIRTSGEQRLSNFLLLQSAYAELYFTKIFWPDFSENEFIMAIEDYQNRERKIGNIDT